MENIAAAIEGLHSYDIETTRTSLHFLVKHGSQAAVKYILPLTVHPDVAIRFFAKKAIRIIRAKPDIIEEAQRSDGSLTGASASVSAKSSTIPFSEDEEIHSSVDTVSMGAIDGRRKKKTVPPYARGCVVI